MKTTKKIRISDVIVSVDNVIGLLKIIYDEYSKKESRHKKFNVILCCSSDIQYEYVLRTSQGSAVEPFPKDEILTRLKERRVLSIDATFTDYDTDTCIALLLEHESNSWFTHRNSIKVEGADETWVMGVIGRIEVAVSNWKKRNEFEKFSLAGFSIIWGSVILFFGIGLFRFLFCFPALKAIFMSPVILAIGALAGFLWVSSACFLGEKTKNLFPSVELLTGPDYLQIEYQKRRQLLTFIILIILPFLLDFIKGLFFRH